MCDGLCGGRALHQAVAAVPPTTLDAMVRDAVASKLQVLDAARPSATPA